MPHERRQFEIGEIYHVTLRRIANELMFGDIHDKYRGIFSIYEFNNANPVTIRERRKERRRFKAAIRGLTSDDSTEVRPLMVEPDQRKKLVDVLAFCLMPNHIHLLLRQIKDNGISKFMQKFGSGYSIYFKEKYEQKGKGHFFDRRFHVVHIRTDDQLRTVFVYIHTNPIALVEPNWKEVGIRDPERAIKFLEEKYRWSSYWDYIGKKNFLSVSKREFLLAVMGGPQGCKDAVNNWIRYKGEIREFKNLGLLPD